MEYRVYCEREFCIQCNQKIFCYTGLLYVFIESSYAVYVAAIISNYCETQGAGGVVDLLPLILHFWKEGSKFTMAWFGFATKWSMYTASPITDICIISINMDLWVVLLKGWNVGNMNLKIGGFERFAFKDIFSSKKRHFFVVFCPSQVALLMTVV
jgi:hypothetical protein